MLKISLLLLAGSASFAAAQQSLILIDYDDENPTNGIHDTAVANGGFESNTDGDTFAQLDTWVGWFPEADGERGVWATGVPGNNGGLTGENGAGNRRQLAQFISTAIYTIQVGDTFTFAFEGDDRDFWDNTDDVRVIFYGSDGAGGFTEFYTEDFNVLNDGLGAYNSFSTTFDVALADAAVAGQELVVRMFGTGDTNEIAGIDNVFLSVETVPEPSALALCLLGMASLLRRRR